MRLTVIVLTGLMVIGGTASASQIEDATGFHYQNDGGVHADAPDICADLDPTRILDIGGNATKGIMVPGDDESDFYNTPTSDALVGERVFVSLRGSSANFAGLDIDVQLPGCLGSVFDESTYAMQEEMLMSHPKFSHTEEPAEGEKTATAKVTGYACDSTEWHFIVNQVAGELAPDHIRVVWSNGDIENIPIQKRTPATVVHYRSTSNLDQPVWSASVNIFEAWKGQFNLGSGPCNGTATEPPAVFIPPLDNGRSGYFTVVTPQAYATQARITDPAKVPGSMTMSCHEFCGGFTDAMGMGFGYDLLSSLAPN